MRWSFWWARAVRQAALLKKPHRGFFPGGTQAPGRSCSNPPARVCLGVFAKEKDQRIFYTGLFGGRGWIRTSRTFPCGFLPERNPKDSRRFSSRRMSGRCINTHGGAHKSGLQSGLHGELHSERLQRARHCQRSGCVLPLHGMTVPPKRVHALAVAHHAAQLCWR